MTTFYYVKTPGGDFACSEVEFEEKGGRMAAFSAPSAKELDTPERKQAEVDALGALVLKRKQADVYEAPAYRLISGTPMRADNGKGVEVDFVVDPVYELEREPAKLADGGVATFDPATATYIAAWDGLAPYVVTLIGTFPLTGIPFMGWPQTDQPPIIPAEEVDVGPPQEAMEGVQI